MCSPSIISSFADLAFCCSCFAYEVGISLSSFDAIRRIGISMFWMLSSVGRDFMKFMLFIIPFVSVVSSPSFWNSSRFFVLSE